MQLLMKSVKKLRLIARLWGCVSYLVHNLPSQKKL